MHFRHSVMVRGSVGAAFLLIMFLSLDAVFMSFDFGTQQVACTVLNLCLLSCTASMLFLVYDPTVMLQLHTHQAFKIGG